MRNEIHGRRSQLQREKRLKNAVGRSGRKKAPPNVRAVGARLPISFQGKAKAKIVNRIELMQSARLV